MSYPLIILGAGASYDFTHPNNLGVKNHSQKPVFPKTDQLIDEKFVDHEIESHYDGFKTIRARLVSPIRKSSFEKCFEGWDDHGQLCAFRLYLGDYFWKKCQEKIIKESPTNFRALIDYIKKSLMKGAYIVTFNYDVLLENELGINKFLNLSDYVSGSIDNIYVIKIHGSCDWYSLMPKCNTDIYTTLINNPKFFNNQNREILTKRWLDQLDSGTDQYFRVPMISLPTISTKFYACPQDHILFLTSVLNNINKILIIGWKGGDTFLLEKLKEIKYPVDLTVVSGTKKGATKVAKIIEKYISIRQKNLFVGFSDFIGSEECNSFFNTN